jgi:hypothetical protein
LRFSPNQIGRDKEGKRGDHKGLSAEAKVTWIREHIRYGECIALHAHQSSKRPLRKFLAWRLLKLISALKKQR